MTTDTTVLIADMAILVGIFLLGLLAKVFPGPAATPAPGSDRESAISDRLQAAIAGN
jgi:hypothetical protein